jgi:hypothetical protein
MATLLVDSDRLFEDVGLSPAGNGKWGNLEVALVGRDALGASGELFFGKTATIAQDPVIADLVVPGGSWRLSALPAAGWAKEPAGAQLFRIGGALIVIFLASVSWLVTHSRRLLQGEVRAHREAKRELLEKALELERTLTEVKTLKGLLPICSHCKKIRDDEGLWNRLERYIEDHSQALLSHGICPTCLEEHYGAELAEAVQKELSAPGS